jgi:hypothetical protein
MNGKDRRVKIRQEEIETLLNLKAKLDDKEEMAGYVAKYRDLAWELVSPDGQGGAPGEPEGAARSEGRPNAPWNPGLAGPGPRLGIRTGKKARLLVLEVAVGPGDALLDRYGAWRADCVAVLGTQRERHFYLWPPLPFFAAVPHWVAPEFTWWGEGQVILLPPAVDPQMQEPWRWQTPPWEKPPQYPPPSVGKFFQERVIRKIHGEADITLTWQEIYCLAAPYPPLLQALSAATPLLDDYYQGIIQAAWAEGLTTPEVLLPLLWHAPQGDVRRNPERWERLKKGVLAGQNPSDLATVPSPLSFELILEQALSYQAESALQGSGLMEAQTGFPGSHRRPGVRSPREEAGPRHPFSCRRIEGGSKGG